MKKILATLCLITASTTAYSQVTGYVGATTDYRFRGISQSQNAMAIQGGVDYAHKSGFYLGNRNATISNRLYGDSTGLEMDFYGGYRMEITKGFQLDVGSYNYVFTQAGNKFASSSNTNEAYLALNNGPFSVKYSRSLGEYFGISNSKGTHYLQADARLPMAKNLTADFHVGRTLVHNHNGLDYTDVRIGATAQVQGFQLGAHYHTNLQKGNQLVGANIIDGQHLYKNALVFTVSRSF